MNLFRGLSVIVPLLMGALYAQPAPKHLNPVIEKLAAGKPFVGVQTGDLSLENARALARADIDYVYLEMEHGPMDFEGLHRFTVGMIDKAAVLKKGNAQPNVAVFARFAPYGRENAQWFVKQALDIGLMGVIFNGIDNPEQALLAVRNMRYPQRKTSKYPEPPGLRGYAPGNAVWWWGVPEAEYERRADLWPLQSRRRSSRHHDDRNGRGVEKRRRDRVGTRCGRNFRGRGKRSVSISRSGTQLARAGAGPPDHPQGLSGAQRALRYHGVERGRYREAARGRVENDSLQ